MSDGVSAWSLHSARHVLPGYFRTRASRQLFARKEKQKPPKTKVGIINYLTHAARRILTKKIFTRNLHYALLI